MRAQPLIVCRDVEASSRFYQQLLGCQSAHGGPEYDRLVDPALHHSQWGTDGLILLLKSTPVTPPHGPEASRQLAGKLIGASGRLQGSLAMPYPPPV